MDFNSSGPSHWLYAALTIVAAIVVVVILWLVLPP
jgi:hypothetical protein